MVLNIFTCLIELLPEVERDPEAVVYNDVACYLRYACGCDLLREVGSPVEQSA